MGKIANFFRRSKADAQQVNVTGPNTVIGELYPRSDDEPLRAPQTVAVVFRCVNAIATRIASLDIEFQSKSRDGVWLPEWGTEFVRLLNVQPNEWQTAYDFKNQLIWQLMIDGDVCVLMERGVLGEVERLLILSSGAAVYNSITGLYDVDDVFWGIYRTVSEQEILHLKRNTFGGVQGVSFMAYAYSTVQTAAAGERENLERFKNGGNVRGFITNEPMQASGYSPHSDKFLRDQAHEKDLFFRAGGRITYMGGAARFQQLMLSSADMQFLESRKFNLLDICRFFGVPPTFAFIDTSSNYKSAENANTDFLNSTLNPLLRQIEMELLRKLVERERWEWRRFRFDRAGVFECDPETKVKWQAARTTRPR